MKIDSKLLCNSLWHWAIDGVHQVILFAILSWKSIDQYSSDKSNIKCAWKFRCKSLSIDKIINTEMDKKLKIKLNPDFCSLHGNRSEYQSRSLFSQSHCHASNHLIDSIHW